MLFHRRAQLRYHFQFCSDERGRFEALSVSTKQFFLFSTLWGATCVDCMGAGAYGNSLLFIVIALIPLQRTVRSFECLLNILGKSAEVISLNIFIQFL